MNEETIIEKRSTLGESNESNENIAWKQVTLGGVSGVLMGAGLLYAGQALAKGQETMDAGKMPEVQTPEAGETSYTLENGLRVAAVNENLSFGEAFTRARVEIGPGGVFHWHGGIYNTYTAEEWNNMSIEQKHHFAQQVQPEIHPNELSTPTDANPQVVVIHHVYHHVESPTVPEPQDPEDAQDVIQVVEQKIAENFDMGDDVHIVGYANADGHLVVGYDTTGDGQADVAIIDVDGDFRPSDSDIIMDNEGHMETLGELSQEPDPYVSMENPDVAPDMPDYMNDAMIDV